MDQTLATGAYTPVASFGGKLIGMKSDLSEEEIRTINVKSVSGVGLFADVSAATVKNIKLTGEISGYANASGGIAGSVTGGATFENCENASEM